HCAYPARAPAPRIRIVDMGTHLAPHGVELAFRPTLTDPEYDALSAPGLTAAKLGALVNDLSRSVRGGHDGSGTLTLVHRLRGLVPTPADLRPLDIYDFDDALYLRVAPRRQG